MSMQAYELHRIALTMKQIQTERPPPNPAKATDARFIDYARKYGTESWELDALRPEYLDTLVRQHIQEHIDAEKWEVRRDEIEVLRERITSVADTFDEAV